MAFRVLRNVRLIIYSAATNNYVYYDLQFCAKLRFVLFKTSLYARTPRRLRLVPSVILSEARGTFRRFGEKNVSLELTTENDILRWSCQQFAVHPRGT